MTSKPKQRVLPPELQSPVPPSKLQPAPPAPGFQPEGRTPGDLILEQLMLQNPANQRQRPLNGQGLMQQLHGGQLRPLPMGPQDRYSESADMPDRVAPQAPTGSRLAQLLRMLKNAAVTPGGKAY